MNQEGKKKVKSSESEEREVTRDFVAWLDQPVTSYHRILTKHL